MAGTAYEFLSERQDRLAPALRGNPDLAAFVQAVLEHVVDHADARGLALSDVTLEPPVVIQQGGTSYVSARVR